MKKGGNMNTRIFEKIYPFLFGLCGAGAIFFFQLKLSSIDHLVSILNAIITFSSIIIAFMSTMVSIFIAINNSSVMKRIKQENAEGDLIAYIIQTVSAGLVLVSFSLTIYLYTNYDGRFSVAITAMLVFLVMFMLAASFRVLYIATNILKGCLGESDSQNEESKEPRIKDSLK